MKKFNNQNINISIINLISNLAEKENVEIYLVGGFVRDLILERKSKDIDVLVIGNGIDFANVVAKKTNERIQVFKNFGTAMLKTKDYEIEFVGARKESYNSDSRKPIVEEGSLEEDLSRRDFTINTLAISLNKKNYGEIVNLFDGINDIKRKIIKTPKNPQETFHDDPLRMFRAARFASQLNFKIDKENIDFIKKEKNRIDIISKERINIELNKILMSDKPSIGFKALNDTGLLNIILPEIYDLHGVDEIEGKKHKDNFHHTLKVVDNICEKTNKLWLRWVALLHDIGKPKTKKFHKKIGWTFHGHEYVGAKMVDRIFKRLKLPLNDKLSYVKKLVSLSSRPIVLSLESITDSAVRRLIYDAGEDIDDLLTLCEADITTKNEYLQKKYLNNFKIVREKIKLVEERDHIRNFQPPVSGEEIMNYFNLKPCKEIGIIKDFIKESILNGDITNSYDEAKELMIKKGKNLGLSVNE
jgi:tRNA nucleotidyltransferase (CCA-adding enzyme)